MSALKEREVPEERVEEPEVANEPAEVDQGSDDDPDIDVERSGNEVVVKQRSEGTRGQRRAAEREEKRRVELDGLRQEIGNLKGSLEQVLSRIQQPAVQPPPQPQKHPGGADDELGEEYMDIVRQQDDVSERVSRCKTQADVDALSLKWHKLEKKRVLLLQPKAPPPVEQGPRFTAEEEALIREFAPVLQNAHAKEVARSHFLAARARAAAKGVPFNEAAAHREAMTKAGEEFGIFRPQAKPPSDAQRGRFAGDRGGAPPGGGGTSITLTDAEKAAAKIWGSDLDIPENQIYAKYAAILMRDKSYMANRKG